MVLEKKNTFRRIKNRLRATLRQTLPCLVGAGALLATVWLWQELEAQERKQLNRKIELAAASFKIELNESIEERVQPLVQIANQWEGSGGSPGANWKNAAMLLIDRFGGYEAIVWLNSEGQIQSVVPILGPEKDQNLKRVLGEGYPKLIEANQQQQNTLITRTIDWGQNGKGFLVYTPIFQNAELTGFLVGVFRTDELFDALVPFLNWYEISIVEGDEEIYDRHPSWQSSDREWRHQKALNLYGIHWNLQVWPKPTLLVAERSILPEVVLGTGIATTFLLFLTTYLAQTAERRSRALEKMNQDLAREIEQRQQTQGALLLKQFCIDRATEAIFWVQADGKIFDVNEAACQYLGYSRDELLAFNISDINPDVYPETWPEYWEKLKQCRSSAVETCYRTKTGRIIPVEMSFNHLEFKGREYKVAFVRDITERKRAEAALKDSQERLNSILESLDDVIWSASVHTGQLLYINPAIEKVYARPVSEFFNYPQLWMEVVHPEDRELVKTSARELLAVGSQDLQYSQDLEYRIVWPSGAVRWIRERSRLIYNAAGVPIRIDGLTTDITQRKQTQIALCTSEERLSTIINTNSDGLIVVDPRGVVRFANPAAENLFGRPASDLLGHWLGSLYVVSELAEISIIRPTGEVVIAEMRVVQIQWENDTAFLASLRDVTQRQQAEERLKKREEQFRLIFELAPTGMAILTPDGRFLKVNQALCNTLGYDNEDLLEQTFIGVTHSDDLFSSLTLHKKLLQGEISHCQLETRYLTKDSSIVNAILQMVLVRDDRGDPVQLIAQIVNITDRKRAEEQLQHNAFYDGLTDLPNWALFMDRLARALQRSKRYECYVAAVLLLDIDHFKAINDSLGHGAGDQLLIAIARRLEVCLRPTDTVARLGGDEFAILLDDIQNIKVAISTAEKIQQELAAAFELEDRTIFATASIGIATTAVDYIQAADLLRDADIAMYRAKEAGRAHHEVFDRAMYARALERLQLETDLRHAIDRQEFLVYYQPIVSLRTGRLNGFEALIRWQHPTRGLVSPMEFIPVAEETGLILPIGQWVFQEACHQLQHWQKLFPTMSSLTVSVNLSSKQFAQADLLEQIDRVLQETGLKGNRLKLEITESVFIDNAKAARIILQALQARQIELCIDDFGTGYSSLSYLHRFPVNTLKVDRFFVSKMNASIETCEIVRTILTLARNLGMNAIAEGIETAQQLNQLKQLGCEYGQGYWFAKPLPAQQATALIVKEPQW